MQAVSLGCLFVDDFLQFCQIAGTCADKFFFQGNLQHNILVADAGSPGERRFLLNSVKNAHDNTSCFLYRYNKQKPLPTIAAGAAKHRYRRVNNIIYPHSP